MPALGAVAAALLAVVLVDAPGRHERGRPNHGRRARVERRLGGRRVVRATAGHAGASRAGDRRAGRARRRVERNVTLALGTTADRFDGVTDGVVRATQRAGGFVAESSVVRNGTRGTATFTLRIPAARLDAAVAGLSRLAHVRSIEQGTTDLTGATDGTAARLRDARTQRRALVAALATASGARAARLRARLDRVSARARALERSLRSLRARTTYATVDLTVTAPRRATAAPASDGRWTPADAWRDARRALEVAAGVAIVLLALGLPLALLAGAAALAGRRLRRRRREGALV